MTFSKHFSQLNVNLFVQEPFLISSRADQSQLDFTKNRNKRCCGIKSKHAASYFLFLLAPVKGLQILEEHLGLRVFFLEKLLSHWSKQKGC